MHVFRALTVAAAVAVTGVSGGLAWAQTAPAPAADPAVGVVGSFYRQYVAACAAPGAPDTGKMARLRAEYLTVELNRQLAAWERTHHADAVLRAQDCPGGLVVRQGRRGNGVSEVLVTERFDGGDTVLFVDVRDTDRRIVALDEEH